MMVLRVSRGLLFHICLFGFSQDLQTKVWCTAPRFFVIMPLGSWRVTKVFIMKKQLWMAAAVCLLSLASCATVTYDYKKSSVQWRPTIAVMDFRAGAGLGKNEVDGLSEMLIHSLYETGKFKIIERSQLDKVCKEQELQQTDLTSSQIIELGEILGVEALVMGAVNYIATEYNVDVRVVDCTTGEIMSTAGATKTKRKTFQELMKGIGEEIGDSYIIITPEEREGSCVYHKVSFWDSLYGIARKYRVSPDDILRWNNISVQKFSWMVGQQLKIYTNVKY